MSPKKCVTRPTARALHAEPRSLSRYLLWAFGLHATFFLLIRAKSYVNDYVPVSLHVPVHLFEELPLPNESMTEPAHVKPASESEPRVLARAMPVRSEPRAASEKQLDRNEEAPAAPAEPRTEATRIEPQDPADEVEVSADKKSVSVNVAAAATQAARRGGGYGLGRGEGRSSGGLGEGFGVTDKGLPVLTGSNVFGSGKKGALRGTLCFLPVTTRTLRHISRCAPEGILYTDMLHIAPRHFSTGFPGISERFEWFAIDFVGRFSVEKAGDYEFRLLSNDGSLLWIDGELVVDNDGQHVAISRSGSKTLSADRHRIRVFYFQAGRPGIALQLFVTPPGGTERLFTPKL